MDTIDTLKARIELLQERLAQSREEKDEALELVETMREHLQESRDMVDQWIEVFDMSQDEAGTWIFDGQKTLWKEFNDLITEHQRMVRDWNKFVGRYNATVAPKNVGRPISASEAQVKEVKRLRKSGESLRAAAAATGLSLRTVRTIIDNDGGKGRTAAKAHEMRRKEFGRMRAAAFRARKRKFDTLPKEITRIQADSARLDKAAKGLHKRAS